jgi:tetratricopeptide (TPR) repeat protein
VLTVLSLVFIGGCGGRKKDKDTIVPAAAELKKESLEKRVEKKWNDANAHYELGKIYQGESQWRKAEREFSVALGQNPVHWESAAAVVRTRLAAGEKKESEILAESYIRQSSYSASASLLLGKAFQREDFDDYALTCYEQALRIAPDSAELNKWVGYYYLHKENEVRAMDYLRRSFEINPRQGDVARALGKLGVKVELPRSKKQNAKWLDKLFKRQDK